MKLEKVIITKENYKKLMLKRMIILCWVLLITCIVIKICGSNLFNVVCNSPKFIEFAEFIESNFVSYFLLSMIFNFSLSLFFILSVDSKIKPTKYQTIYILILSIIISFCKVLVIFMERYELTGIFDILHFIAFIFVVKRKNNLLIAIPYYFLFMLISNFTKGFSLNLADEPLVITLIMSIDVIIMLSLLYLYSNKKGDIFMGALFIFLSKDIAQLETYKSTLKDPKKIAKVEARIAKLKKEQNKED